MKSVDDTRAEARTWLDRHLSDHIAGPSGSHSLTISLRAPAGSALQAQWRETRDCALSWRHAEATLTEGIELQWKQRMLGPTRQQLPTHLHLPTLDSIATWSGEGYPAVLAEGRSRWAALTAALPATAQSSILRAVMRWTDTDFQLLISTAQWFEANPMADNTWTPRQVPVPGLHAKWLDQASRRTVIARLINTASIELRNRPLQARITYLDPDHITAGRRRWDIITAGDHLELPYQPETVLVVENRDTAFYFPPAVPSGVVLLGNGDAVLNQLTTIEQLISAAARVVYWGDIDADGLRIVSRIRSRGHHITTVLMDLATYQRYERFGTNLDQHGRPIAPADPTPPPGLTADESSLYLRLADPSWDGHRRIEQERIPLSAALEALGMTAQGGPGHPADVAGNDLRHTSRPH